MAIIIPIRYLGHSIICISATGISKQSQNNITSNEGSSFTATTSSSVSMVTDVKSIDKFHDGIKENFNLDNNNRLSILKSKDDPKIVIYDLQNQNGCKIHLEKMDDRVMLLSVDNTGKRFHISCNF
ncbi:hypothetical protein DINM_004752 [Dirofilaria immitis]|nr:hypothetical protein [Dirofilaria immitis]